MTVTLSKRLFEESASSSACLASPPASKKLRALTPLADHLPTSSHGKPGVPGLGSLQQHQHSSARKRRHDTAAEGTNGAASPPTGLKRVRCVFEPASEAAGSWLAAPCSVRQTQAGALLLWSTQPAAAELEQPGIIAVLSVTPWAQQQPQTMLQQLVGPASKHTCRDWGPAIPIGEGPHCTDSNLMQPADSSPLALRCYPGCV